MKRFFGCALACASMALVGVVGTANAQPNTIAGLELWLDASDAGTFTLSGSDVLQWRDKSGNGFHAAPHAAGLEPNLVAGALGGQAAVRFNATASNAGDGLQVNSPLNQFSRDYTIFIVDQYSGAIQGRTLQGRDGNNWLMGKWSTRNAHHPGPSTWTYLPAANAHSTAIGEAIGGTPGGYSTYHLNGANVTGIGGSAAPPGFPGRLGIAMGGGFAEASNADVAEVIAFNRVLSWNERRDVGRYLEQKYSGLGNFYTSRAADSASIGSFTGADPGQGLDFSGNFQYAVDFGGTGTNIVGDATFIGTQSGAITGVTFTAGNVLTPGAWGNVEYGASASNNAFETVMESIRWASGTTIPIDLANLTAGEDYRLQLLFGDNNASATRGFQVEVENSILAPGFMPTTVQGIASNTTRGAHVTYDFVAQDGVANIRLQSLGGFTDNNPIINALTLEFFPDAEATPSSGSLSFAAEKGEVHQQTLTITNSGEAGSKLYLNSAGITGPDAADFQILNFLANTELDVGEEVDLVIQFTGNEPGFESFATLTFATNLNTLYGATSGGDTISFALSAMTTPEPSAIALWSSLGVVGLGYSAWRRQRRVGA